MNIFQFLPFLRHIIYLSNLKFLTVPIIYFHIKVTKLILRQIKLCVHIPKMSGNHNCKSSTHSFLQHPIDIVNQCLSVHPQHNYWLIMFLFRSSCFRKRIKCHINVGNPTE